MTAVSPEPTHEQLRSFYQVARRAVLLSCFIAFVELGEDTNLYVHIGRYDTMSSGNQVRISLDGRLFYD